MKSLAIAVGTILTAAAPAVLAQDNSDRNYPYDPDWAARQQAREAYRYGHGWGENRWRDDWRYERRDYDRRDDWNERRWREERQWRDERWGPRRECWNPRAGHFEEDRPGEYQNDLDYSRCRALGWRY